MRGLNMVIKCRINGVDVAITKVDTKWGRVYFTLNGRELFEWFESDFSELWESYKLVSSKYEFIKENGEYFRNHFVIIKDNNEYIDFLNRLYDFLQDHLKNCGKGQNEMNVDTNLHSNEIEATVIRNKNTSETESDTNTKVCISYSLDKGDTYFERNGNTFDEMREMPILGEISFYSGDNTVPTEDNCDFKIVFEGRCYTKGENGIDEDYIQREITLSLKAKLDELFKD